MDLPEYYLPPVIEKNARKGYKPPSRGEQIASIILYLDGFIRRKGFFKRRRVEELSRILILHYPIDLFCRGDECIIVDPVTGEVIRDVGFIAQVVFLLQHPSKTPYLEPEIELEALNPVEPSDELFSDESVLVPRPKTGEARYYVPLIIARYRGEEGNRIIIVPPLYYLTGFKKNYPGIRSFDNIVYLVKRVPLDESSISDQMDSFEWLLDRGDLRKSLEQGLQKLRGKGIVKKKTVDEIIENYIRSG